MSEFFLMIGIISIIFFVISIITAILEYNPNRKEELRNDVDFEP